MAKPTKFLVATDSRFSPDHRAGTSLRDRENIAGNPRCSEKELVELVSEAAKTFGFQSKTT